MHPVGAFGHEFGFIRLHVADDVPHDVGQIGQILGFFIPFLNIVFAEIALSGGVYFADVAGGKGFTHRHQPHAFRRPACLGGGTGNVRTCISVILLQGCHLNCLLFVIF